VTERWRPATELEAEARAINAEPWELMPAWRSDSATGAATSSPHRRPAMSRAVRIASERAVRHGFDDQR
jgi:hypothetical protein